MVDDNKSIDLVNPRCAAKLEIRGSKSRLILDDQVSVAVKSLPETMELAAFMLCSASRYILLLYINKMASEGMFKFERSHGTILGIHDCYVLANASDFALHADYMRGEDPDETKTWIDLMILKDEERRDSFEKWAIRSCLLWMSMSHTSQIFSGLDFDFKIKVSENFEFRQMSNCFSLKRLSDKKIVFSTKDVLDAIFKASVCVDDELLMFDFYIDYRGFIKRTVMQDSWSKI